MENQIAKLNENYEVSWTRQANKPIVIDGIEYPASIFYGPHRWSTAALKDIGYARCKIGTVDFTYSNLLGYEDSWDEEGIIRIPIVEDKTDLEPFKSNIKLNIKAEANRLILKTLPDWKQRNILAQGIILNDKGRENWTTEEIHAWDTSMLLWSRIVSIRTRSDELEALVDDMTLTDIKGFNVNDSANWPE